MAHYEQNETAKALDELRTAISLDAKVRLAHFYAGMIHVRTGKLDEAAREFEAELALNPARRSGKISSRLRRARAPGYRAGHKIDAGGHP